MERLSTNHNFQSSETALDRESKLPEVQKWLTNRKPLI